MSVPRLRFPLFQCLMIKAVIWRFVSCGMTILISGVISHNLEMGLKIGVIEFFLKLGSFMIYDYCWLKKGCLRLESKDQAIQVCDFSSLDNSLDNDEEKMQEISLE